MNLLPWNQNNQQSQQSENGTANALMNAAKKSSIVSTAQPIQGFEKRTEGQNAQYKKDLDDRKKQTKLFNDYVRMNLQWQEQDVESTKTLTQWRVETTKNLGKHAVIVAKGAAQQQAIGARVNAQIGLIQNVTAQRIQEIEAQSQQKAQELLGRKRGQ
ncbi:MAG TPA: hypothetical protein V6C65_26870 [Allocoleopsis sp.]